MIRLLRLKTGAKQISLGIVIGFFPCWFPTFFFGPLLSVALTKLMKGNLIAAIISASVGSFLWPILFLFNYQLGALLTNKQDTVTETTEIDYDKEIYLETIEEGKNIFGEITDKGMSFVVGSLVNSIVFTIIGYFLFYYILSRYREKMLHKLR
jgi:uncharacterized protein (DUF2062 family)